MTDKSAIDTRSAAVVMCDMINGSLKNRANPAAAKAIEESGLVANVAQFVLAVRQLGVPILWIHVRRRADEADIPSNLTDAGGRFAPLEGWDGQQVDELPIAPEDHVVLKPRRDPFIGTDLDLQLRVRGVDTILLGGYATNWVVESTARTAYDLGYNVVTLSDCCWNVDAELHAVGLERILPRLSRVMSSDEVLRVLR